MSLALIRVVCRGTDSDKPLTPVIVGLPSPLGTQTLISYYTYYFTDTKVVHTNMIVHKIVFVTTNSTPSHSSGAALNSTCVTHEVLAGAVSE